MVDIHQAVEIVLVEDNFRDAELMIHALQKRNLANRLLHLEDGAQALEFLLGEGEYAGRIDGSQLKVVLLDIKLPKLNGLEVLKAIRACPETRSIPVVMVTSSAEDPDLKAAYQLGANSYVVKPVDFAAFQEAMNMIGYYWLLVNQPARTPA